MTSFQRRPPGASRLSTPFPSGPARTDAGASGSASADLLRRIVSVCEPTSSVLRHPGIDTLSPSVDSAREVLRAGVARLLQELDGLPAPGAGAAIDHDLVVLREAFEARRQGAERNLHRVLQIRDRVLVRLTDVDEDEPLAAVPHLLQRLDADLGSPSEHCRRRYQRLFPAEGLVIDELRHGGLLSTDYAIRVLPDAELAKTHRERVDEHEPADQGVSRLEEQLERLRRLHGSEQAGQDSEDPAFGAGGHKSRRRRLGEEAAVAGALLRPEDRDLALELEDGCVDVGTPRQYARVVDEVAGREVVRAVGDHVELTDDAQGVVRGQP